MIPFKTILHYSYVLKLSEPERHNVHKIITHSENMFHDTIKDICRIGKVSELDDIFKDDYNIELLMEFDNWGCVENFDDFPISPKCVYTAFFSTDGSCPFHGVRYYDNAKTAATNEFQRLLANECFCGISCDEESQCVLDRCKRISTDMSLLLSWMYDSLPDEEDILKALRIIFKQFEHSYGTIDSFERAVKKLPYETSRSFFISTDNNSKTPNFFCFDWDNYEHIESNGFVSTY